MPIARVQNGAILEFRNMDLANVPAHKQVLWVPVVYEGEGPNEQTIVEVDQVRIVRSGPTKDQLVVHAASKRWTIQSGGITLNGAQIDTSTDSLALITGAIESLERGWTTAPIRFKAKNAWLDLSLADLQGAAAAVSQHVQNCFSAEAAVVTKINNDTYTTVAAVDGASEWPVV